MQISMGVVCGGANRKTNAAISLRRAALLRASKNIVAGVDAFGSHCFLQAGSDAYARLPAKFLFCANAIKLHASERRFDPVEGKRDWAFQNIGQNFETE